jgi:predicted NAD/FAD-dependent oxidoreductase
MATRRAGGMAFDHGASFFTVSDDRFRGLVREWVERGRAAPWARRWAMVRDGVATVVPAAERFVAVPGMSAACRDLLAGVECRYSTQVLRLGREHGLWEVVSADGATHGTFDTVLIAAPPAQAAQLAGDSTHVLSQVRVPDMRPCWAVAVTVPASVQVPFDAAAVAGSPLGWIARENSKPGRRAWPETWMLHATAEWSETNLEADATWVGRELLGAFRHAVDRGDFEASVVLAHRWRYARPDARSSAGSLFDAGASIGFCGDWLTGGRVESAALSGWDLADQVTASHPALAPAGGAV